MGFPTPLRASIFSVLWMNSGARIYEGASLSGYFALPQYLACWTFVFSRYDLNVVRGDGDMEQLPEKKSPLKNPYLYSLFLILIVLIYLGYTFYSRRESNREFEKQREEKSTEQRREDDRRAIEQLGGSELAVQSLYVAPASIHRGEKAQLCYNVSNAKTVVLDPPEGNVWPSHFRCI